MFAIIFQSRKKNADRVLNTLYLNFSKVYGQLFFIHVLEFEQYGKCPKVSYTKVVDKMTYANSADEGQTAPEGAV